MRSGARMHATAAFLAVHALRFRLTAARFAARFSTRRDADHMIEKIFKAYDVRATYPNPLNEDAAWKVGHATAQFLKRNRDAQAKVKLAETILVGRDMRPHSPALAAALSDGIRSVGMN